MIGRIARSLALTFSDDDPDTIPPAAWRKWRLKAVFMLEVMMEPEAEMLRQVEAPYGGAVVLTKQEYERIWRELIDAAIGDKR